MRNLIIGLGVQLIPPKPCRSLVCCSQKQTTEDIFLLPLFLPNDKIESTEASRFNLQFTGNIGDRTSKEAVHQMWDVGYFVRQMTRYPPTNK